MARICRVLALAFIAALPMTGWPANITDPVTGDSPTAALPGHVLESLPKAALGPALKLLRGDEPLSLTIVLRRSNEPGFQAYLEAVYDRSSPDFLKFMTPTGLAEAFGPSLADYARVKDFFVSKGFTTVEESANRMTLTLSGSRTLTEQTFRLRIGDYKLGETSFHANDRDPLVPTELAPRIHAVVGLSNLGRPQPNWGAVAGAIGCEIAAWVVANSPATPLPPAQAQTAYENKKAKCKTAADTAWKLNKVPDSFDPPPPAWQGADGTGQTIGIVAFDTYDPADVTNFENFAGLPAGTAAHVTRHPVAGGATAGPDQSEVLLDIDNVITIASGASVRVYDAPFNGAGSFQAVFNAMINGGVSIITNSWAYCENQTTLADVTSIESILQTAAAAGISAFSGAGDHGSMCLNGSPNVAHVPATSPHMTAVGGTSLTGGPGHTYLSETWWDSSALTPPGGQGGYGTSIFFNRPSYQDGLNAGAMRTIPDVSTNADPAKGVFICQANRGGCPTGLYYGGTSSATPIWAAFAALLNQTQGTNLGFMNAHAYAFAGTDAFHSPASMGTDFAHVGLGSPNLARFHQHLTSQTPGTVDGAVSQVHAFLPGDFAIPGIDSTVALPVPADGASQAFIVVRLYDANGNVIGGKNVALTPSAGSSATITPASGVTDAANGFVIFSVKNLVAQTVTFTATDTTDNIPLAQTSKVAFLVPPVASAGILASPSSVPADGTTVANVTVTLLDVLARPTPGKLVTLSQGDGHSVITGPVPAVTDVNGQIVFHVTNRTNQIVTYTAEIVSDGNVPVPGSTAVTFTGAGSSCLAAPPAAATGYLITPFANGFPAQNFNYSNVNWGGCPGSSNPAFDEAGGVYVSSFYDGKLYKFTLSGGAVSSANALSSLGQTLQQAVFGKDGKLYASRGATGAGFTTGVVIEVDKTTGALVRTLANNLTCPSPLSVDPLSGDLFFTDSCFGAGADNPSIWRVQNPGGASPAVSVYATLPGTPSGTIAFSPDGSLYAVSSYTGAGSIIRITGTNMPAPHVMATLSGISSDYWVTMGETLPDGSAKSLIAHSANAVKLIDLTTVPFTITNIATGVFSTGSIGPDGCIYAGASDTVYKITTANGTCGFASANPGPFLGLSPSNVSLAQGTTATITASITNADAPAQSPVWFSVIGPNQQNRLATTDAAGVATVTLKGVFTGMDQVSARTIVGSTLYQSATSRITWTAGKHATYIGLAGSPSSGAPGQQPAVSASLFDVSQIPQVAIAGATVQFTIGTANCSGVTNASGVATCTLTLPATGNYSLTASFAGDGNFIAASTSQGFTVVGNRVLDVDLDGTYDPMTDGILVIRHLFGISGPALTSNSTGTHALRNALDITLYLQGLGLQLDVDNNGQVDALTDGLLMVRYMSGVRGNALINGAIGGGALRTGFGDIEQYIQSLMP